MAPQEIFLILHDIRSMENVGSIFRTADAAGVAKIFLTGYTPAPLDRFGRKNSKLSKAALGAEGFVSWERAANVQELLQKLKEQRITCVALEQHDRSVSFWKIPRGIPLALVLGNEVLGVPEEVISVCDMIAEIPMLGKKESLNVAVSAGVVLYEMLRPA
ncbi:MAG TPA: TrmH family RNA methyltransferase [Candidatus Paceibacterota bacterium]|nr:TrmH family RNA methyltransferase [Candidatus Paceibacterota bacterium]